MSLYGHNPRIRVDFTLRTGQRFSMEDRLISYQSQRSLADPTARATLVIRGDGSDIPGVGKPLEDVLSDYDLAVVSMLDGSGFRRVRDIVGLVHVVSTSRAEQNSAPNTTTTINLVGLGEILKHYQIFWISPRGNRFGGAYNYETRSGQGLAKGRPHQVLRHIYNTFMGDDEISPQLANGRDLIEAIRLDFADIPDSLNTIGVRATRNQGTLWPILISYADFPWTELFFHIPVRAENAGTPPRDFDVTLTLRPTPWTFSLWHDLKNTPGWGFRYDPEERMGPGEVLSHNPDKVYNMFWCLAKSSFSKATLQATAHDLSGQKMPIVDFDSIRQGRGVRLLECQTEYIHFAAEAEAKTGTLTGAQKQLSNTQKSRIYDLLYRRAVLLYLWNGYERFKEGVIVTRGRVGPSPEHGARIGSVLSQEDGENEGYVVGIGQSWSFPGPHITQWQIARWHDPKDYKEWWSEKGSPYGDIGI